MLRNVADFNLLLNNFSKNEIIFNTFMGRENDHSDRCRIKRNDFSTGVKETFRAEIREKESC